MRPRQRLFVATLCLLPSFAALAVEAPEDRFFDSAGVKIRYTVQGEGEPLVLVHGFTARIETNWGLPGIIDTLARDFQVIAMDARGHGKSDKPHDPAAYGIHMMQDVVRLLDHLGILKAHVAGYSMGGGITLQMLVTYPDRFRSAILAGSGWRTPGGELESMMTALAESLEAGQGIGPLIVALNPIGQPLPTAEEIAAANERLMAMNDPLALAAVIRGGAQNEPIGEERLRANRVPTLAVVGEIDPVKTGVDAMVGVMENLEVKVLPGKDHLTAVADPGLAEAMRAFLLAHSGESGAD